MLGLRLDGESGASSAAAADSAFHEDGLLYVNTGETAGRVLKKLIRAAFALKAYLDVDETDIVFATPKMAEPIREAVQRHLAILEMRRRAARLSHAPPALPVIANTDFSTEILAPVLERVDAVADTSELFMRAQQLMRLCNPARNRSSSASLNRPASAPTEGGSRIGEHVRRTMAALAALGR